MMGICSLSEADVERLFDRLLDNAQWPAAAKESSASSRMVNKKNRLDGLQIHFWLLYGHPTQERGVQAWFGRDEERCWMARKQRATRQAEDFRRTGPWIHHGSADLCRL